MGLNNKKTNLMILRCNLCLKFLLSNIDISNIDRKNVNTNKNFSPENRENQFRDWEKTALKELINKAVIDN